MIDDFDDYSLMCSNLAKLGWSSAYALRVSKEHYTWLARAPSLVRSIVHTAGGIVDGHPTSEINILQRIRQLVEIEREANAPPFGAIFTCPKCEANHQVENPVPECPVCNWSTTCNHWPGQKRCEVCGMGMLQL